MRYIADALAVFEKQGPEARHAIALEIALLGNQGLDVNNPEQKYSLKALPGLVLGSAPAVHHVSGVPPDRSGDGSGDGLRSRVPSGDGVEKGLRIRRLRHIFTPPPDRPYRFGPMSRGGVCG